MVAPAIELRDVHLSIGREAILNGLSLSVPKGHFLCLLGPSGSGKSTTLRAIAGLDPISDGEILLNGKAVSSARRMQAPDKRGVGLMFQDFALFPHLSVLQNVMFGLRRLSRFAATERARLWLSRVDLSDFEDRMPASLSGGQQQRVALARALAPQPEILLLDEPFSGLDRALRAQLRDDFLHLIKESGITTIMVTHDPDEAMFMADSITVMRDGQIEQQGTPDRLYFQPDSAFVTSFFGDINRLPGTVESGQISTPLGSIKPSPLPEGTAVEVLIRPEALLLCPVNDLFARLPKVAIEASRMVGHSSVIHMELLSDPVETGGERPHLHARVNGNFLPAPGEQFGIGVNPDLCYVFESVTDTAEPAVSAVAQAV